MVAGKVRLRERVHRSPERRQAGGVTIGVARRQAIEQQVGGPRRLRTHRRDAGRGGYLLQVLASAEAAGEDARCERFEVGLTRQTGIDRLKTSGGCQQHRGRVLTSRASECDLSAQPPDAGAMELVERRDVRRGEELDAVAGPAASNFACAAASARIPRWTGSGVSSAARARNAAAAAM